ncbi:hypothetical protein GO755_14720 [Spirosoma sp. HMF4905]|uniref:Uncharacterized protein n=1 Tax=Spirosoma arboris TaxID=2682092 RepID=A0A7K1SBV4_9BACT|nr:hypothetical protein [Spirosoma arboris]MVM31294.1 hypothetical protein [Spirosoma arboris]
MEKERKNSRKKIAGIHDIRASEMSFEFQAPSSRLADASVTLATVNLELRT